MTGPPGRGLRHWTNSPILVKILIVKKPRNQPRNNQQIKRRRHKLRKRTMNFSTWNVQGWTNKVNEIVYELQKSEIALAVITETKKKGKGSENLGHFDHFYSGVPKDKHAQQGVSILISKKLRQHITSWEPINERIIKMNLTLKAHKITILGVYAVNDDALVNKKNEFFEQLHREITNIGDTREIIILGDLNSRTGSKVQDKVVGQYGEQTVNDNGQRLITLCEQNDLKITNGYYPHKEIHKYTWTKPSQNLKSIIDYLIVQQKTNLKICNVRVHRGPTCGSDHYLLNAKIAFPHKKQIEHPREQDETEKVEPIKYNLESLQHDSTKHLYKNRLDQKLQLQNFQNTTEHYNYIKNCLHEAAKESIGYLENTNRQKPYWWDEEIEKEIETKKQAHEKYLSTQTEHHKESYKQSQRRVRNMITQKKNETWERRCDSLNCYIGGSKSSESWRFLKSLRQEKTKEIISPITLNQWDKYFTTLLTEDREQFKKEPEKYNRVQVSASPIRISGKEVKEICSKLKNRKAPGPGDIPAELVKYGTPKLYESLRELFQNCLNSGEVPPEWKLSYMSTIHKKGSKEVCDNYRGIAVMSTISRIYGKIIKAKIEHEYADSEAEEQAGFRAGRSTIDHLFCITQINEKMTAVNKEVHALYVDLKKAYDSVPLTKLWEALEITNINANLIKAVQQLYRNCQIKIKIGNKISKGFLPNKGLKQGCCMSPTLFKIFLEKALSKWKLKCKGMGIPLNENILYTLSFADDQIVLAQDIEDLEYMTRKLVEEYEKWGLEVNLTKTKYMCIGGTQQDLMLEDGRTLKSCSKYKYLGLNITNDGTLDEAIKERNVQGRKAIRMLNTILWDQKISKENKHRIYNTIVKSIVTYGSEVWQLKEKSMKTLEATEMDYWRRSAGKSRLERIRNERIREVMGIKHTIVEDIKIKQLKWYGHVQRMSTERLPKQILQWTPTGRRRRGRPRKSWREGIDKEMEERGLEEGQWNSRSEWRLGIGRRRRTL